LRQAWIRLGRVKTPSGWARELFVSPAGDYALEVGGQAVRVEQDAVQWAVREHLELLIKLSGLSRRRFAEQRLARNETTLRRWTSGKIPIPKSVVNWMTAQSVVLAAADDVEALDTIGGPAPEHLKEGRR
jgi:hypothetical protein